MSFEQTVSYHSESEESKKSSKNNVCNEIILSGPRVNLPCEKKLYRDSKYCNYHYRKYNKNISSTHTKTKSGCRIILKRGPRKGEQCKKSTYYNGQCNYHWNNRVNRNKPKNLYN